MPIKVVTSRLGGKHVTAGVCIGNRGPFTFLVDTGAEVSVIDPSVAGSFQHVDSGESSASFCGGIKGLIRPDLRLGGRSIQTGPLPVADLHSIATNLNGILGADQLSQMGMVRIDYLRQTMTLGAPGSAPTTLAGSADPTSVPAAVRSGTTTDLPMRVVAQHLPDDLGPRVQAFVKVRVGGKPEAFVVDTGAGDPAISPTVPVPAGSVPSAPIKIIEGIGCTSTARTVTVKTWRVGSVRMQPQLFVQTDFAEKQVKDADRFQGLLGSGALSTVSPDRLPRRHAARAHSG